MEFFEQKNVVVPKFQGGGGSHQKELNENEISHGFKEFLHFIQMRAKLYY